MREGKFLPPRVASLAVLHLLLGPGEELAATLFEERSQRLRRMRLDEGRLLLRADVEVDQGDIERLEAAGLAQQVRVDLRLRPVQVAVVGRLLGEITAVRLDLLEPVARGVVAVGAPADGERPEFAAQGDLRLVVLAAAAGPQLVSRHAFLRAGRRREAQVEVAASRGELAQGADGD